MRRTPVKLIAIVVAALAAAGTGVAAASVQPPASASHHGTERITLMLTSTSGIASAIATGLFTDGGTVDVFSAGPSAVLKLAAGTIRLDPTSHVGPSSKRSPGTCLTTVTERGTYKLSRGTGRYAGIRGSGRFSVIDHVISRRKPDGMCVTSRPPLAVQAVFTFSGPATLPH